MFQEFCHIYSVEFALLVFLYTGKNSHTFYFHPFSVLSLNWANISVLMCLNRNKTTSFLANLGRVYIFWRYKRARKKTRSENNLVYVIHKSWIFKKELDYMQEHPVAVGGNCDHTIRRKQCLLSILIKILSSIKGTLSSKNLPSTILQYRRSNSLEDK